MSRKFFRYPPRPSSGSGTFSDNIVGLQTVDGGGLTQGNFEFTQSVTERVTRNFNIGAFSDPINLENLNISNDEESRLIIAKEYGVYPNFDLSDVTNFTIYGSMSKRLEISIKRILNYFPAALEVSPIDNSFNSGDTAYNITYDNIENISRFTINVSKILNPFDIDYSVNSTINIQSREMEVSYLRNLTQFYSNYSLFVNGFEYPILNFTASTSIFQGELEFMVNGKPFTGNSTTDYLVIRPNSYYTEVAFTEPFDEIEEYLLNRLIVPKYSANFQVPKQTDDGQFYSDYTTVTWPIDGEWNLDIRTVQFQRYVDTIGEISENFDTFRTNTVARFLITDSFKEFDTPDQSVSKILQIWGREFDEIKKFIDGLSFMNSVNYNTGNDIPSALLKNLAETLGWNINVSPITEEDFLESVFGNGLPKQYSGYERSQTPNELNFQFYKNLILNSAYLFKSKGTRKSIEFLLRMIGAPEPLIEFNENIYLADGPINMSKFNSQFTKISGGTYVEEIPVLQSGVTFTILGNQFTSFTNQFITLDSFLGLDDYPVDDEGYPKSPIDTPDYFFQKGAGWYELTPQHQSPQQVNITTNVFTGQNTNIQTQFEPFTYGQKYLDRFREFPFINDGFKLTKTPDNKKSWVYNDTGLRISTENGFNSYYYVDNEKLVLNVKNIDLCLNPGQGLVYDVWYMSNKYDYPIPNSGLTNPYPNPGGVDWTIINPQPKKKTFFEFAQTFWKNMINVRNRQFISDGKTGGYPTLQSIWWKYLNSGTAINVPNDNFTYQRMIDYVVGMGDYWMKLVEQMIPATTIWNGGIRYENSVLHRQKFVYRLQRGCKITPVPCEPCSITSALFPPNCINESITCPLFPWNDANITSFSDILYQTLTDYLNNNSLILNDCYVNTLISEWYVDIRVDSNILIQEKFYTGFGLNDTPSENDWVTALNTYLPQLSNHGMYYTIQNNDLVLYNLTCSPNYPNKVLEINSGINFQIICND